MLEARDERGVFELAGRAERIQHVTDHCAVHFDVLALGCLSRPCGKEDVTEMLSLQRIRNGLRGSEIGCDGFDAVGRFGASARETRYVPASARQ